MALTAFDSANLSSAQQAGISAATAAWNKANAAGDRAAMDAAHAQAEAIRNAAGYTSDDSGNYVGAFNTVADSYIPNFQDLLNQVKTTAEENNARAQENAQAQWEFNRQEAEKNRNWQEYMSNTAHQREVQDLLKAGLNPVLSAGGNGAAVTSGSTASGSQAGVDSSVNSVFGNYVSSLINSATAINNANTSAKSAERVARINTEMNYKIAHDFPTTNKVLGEIMQDLLDWLKNRTSNDEVGTNSWTSDKYKTGTDLPRK